MKKISILIIPLLFLSFFIGFIFIKNWNNNENIRNNINNSEKIIIKEKNMEVKKEIIKEGSGEQQVEKGNSISVHYTGTFEDGAKFDSSVDRNQPFNLTVGIGQVIQGWDQGLIGMKVGEKSKLTIPPEMAYGPAGIPGAIPPNSTLIFEVELLEIK
jgi:FKBP-type peptidyl-prolyl cis-trans isomerase